MSASTILFLLGAGIELAQHLTGRSGSLADISMNLLGIVGGICFCLLTSSSVSVGKKAIALLTGIYIIR